MTLPADRHRTDPDHTASAAWGRSVIDRTVTDQITGASWAEMLPGRDRRARVWHAAPGRPAVTTPAPQVAVVGGGIAGLAAATGLAERGVSVTLYEREPTLGGRVAGWPVRLSDGSRATMSRGFHAFFRQYYNLRGLLRRADPTLCALRPLPDYPLQHSRGTRDSFAKVPRTPPLSALGFVTHSPTFTWSDLARINARAALPLLNVRVPHTYQRLDGTSARAFLDAIRFPPAARQLAFEVFSRSFFADPGLLSAAELALMFHIYFLGSSEGLLFDVPAEPYPQALWDPLARHLLGHRAMLHSGTAIETVRPLADGRFMLEAAGEAGGSKRFDAVVLALDAAGLRALVEQSAELGDESWRQAVGALRTAPPFLVTRLWLDRPVAAGREGFLGTSGYGPLDNVSVLERWEGEAARWAAEAAGSVVELHAYAVAPDADRAQVQEQLLAQLHRIYPETRAARVLDAQHVWRADCPLFPVGGYAQRPGVRTPHPGLVLAGDMVRCALPVALMERAATTGFLAANTLLARWGVSGQTLWSVPAAGRSAILRALARLG